jgi:hypothetical protein
MVAYCGSQASSLRHANGGLPSENSMASTIRLIKVGRQGVLFRNSRIPASFFRHQQPGKPFVVLDDGDRRLMHVRSADMDAIRRAYREYAARRRGGDGTAR